MGRTRFETPQTLTLVVTSNDDPCHPSRSAQDWPHDTHAEKPFAPRNHQAADVQNPECVVQHRRCTSSTFPPLSVQILLLYSTVVSHRVRDSEMCAVVNSQLSWDVVHAAIQGPH